ncbi:MAG TPA: acyl-ACP thioesterase domain-containing protein [Solirubrobacterales bacterium]|nr:acyl-ACP thioesterase domain-containing protein [Solirubrobacterales bacterium]
MVGLPERGRIYEGERLVGGADVDAAGRVRLNALARWLQEVAFADALDAGLPAQSAWIIRRTLISVERWPAFAERLTLKTFCSAIAKSVADRRTSISGDRGGRVEAAGQWVQIDPETRRPLRFDERFLGLYAESASGRRARSRLRHPAPDAAGESTEQLEWRFREADVDLVGHVNNTAYWQIAEEFLDLSAMPEGARCDIEIEFRGGSVAGPATVLRGGAMLWVLDGTGEVSASISAEPGG